MRASSHLPRPLTTAAMCTAAMLFGTSCSDNDDDGFISDRPIGGLGIEFIHPVGNAMLGQEVFRFETFGNEGFWTDAMRLPQGLVAAGLTPLQALQLGLNVNFDALNAPTKAALGDALTLVENGTDPAVTALGDPAVTLSLINQNAIIGVVAVDPSGMRKPLGATDTLDLMGGDKIGVSCALCHAITDNSVLPATPALGTRGSIGAQVDGPTPHGLDVGAILAAAERTLAYYPMLQLRFDALGDATIGRGGFVGLAQNASEMPTEADADAYLTGTASSGQRFYPVGQFDAFPDGIGNPLHIAPFFRTDLAAPWGIDGGVEQLQDFNNTVYTVSLDPTTLLTPGGRMFLEAIAGPVGTEIADDYEQVLRDIGVIASGQAVEDAVPFVDATGGFMPGSMTATVGLRVREVDLLDLNGYLDSLPIPLGEDVDDDLSRRGRELFRTSSSAGGAGCTECHQVDPRGFVPTMVVPIERMYPGYEPTVLFDRMEPLSDIQDSAGPSPFFDDRLIVLDATRGGRGEVRGIALPLLLDLQRRTSLLHDDSVNGADFDEAADALMNPARGPDSAHPFYVDLAQDRRAIIEFLKGLDGER